MMAAKTLAKNEKINFHGHTGTVAAINNDEAVIHFGAGEARIVRTLSLKAATHFADQEVFDIGTRLDRPVNDEQGRYAGCDALYIKDNHSDMDSYIVEVSLVSDAGVMGPEENYSPHKTAVEWWLKGLPEKPEIKPSKGAKPDKAKVADDTAPDTSVPEEAILPAIKTAVDASLETSRLAQKTRELEADLAEVQRQNVTLLMDNANLQDKVESLERKVAALTVRVPVDIKYVQVNLGQYETKDALLKDLKDGWEVAHETVLENSMTTYRYRLVKYSNSPDPLPMPHRTSAAATVANGAGQYIMQGNNANIVASSEPQGLPLTFNRLTTERGATRRIPVLQESNMRLGAKLIDLQERSDQRYEAARRQFANTNNFSGAE